MIFKTRVFSESNMRKQSRLFMRVHYDLVTLKIGSGGVLSANWKTNQYNSI